MKKPSNRIREIRIKKKISGTKMAKELGISPQYFYDLEKGERNLSTDLAAKIAVILNVSVDYLIFKTDDEQLARIEATELDEKNKILKAVNLLTDDEGYFYEDLRKEVFNSIDENIFFYFSREDLGRYRYGYEHFEESFAEFEETTSYRKEELIEEFNAVFNYRTIKLVIDYLDIYEREHLLNAFQNIIIKHQILDTKKTPSEKEFMNKLELSKKDLLNNIDLQLDGEKLTEEEAKGVIAYLRTLREFGKQ